MSSVRKIYFGNLNIEFISQLGCNHKEMLLHLAATWQYSDECMLNICQSTQIAGLFWKETTQYIQEGGWVFVFPHYMAENVGDFMMDM